MVAVEGEGCQRDSHTGQGHRIWLMGFRLSQDTEVDCLIGYSRVDIAGPGSKVLGRVNLYEMRAFLCISVHLRLSGQLWSSGRVPAIVLGRLHG